MVGSSQSLKKKINTVHIIKTVRAVPDISYSCKIYLKSQADLDGILNDQSSIDKLTLLLL